MSEDAHLKQRLRAGRPGNGCWIHLFHAPVAEIVAQAGYDCVMIDLEHGPGDLGELMTVLPAVERWACAPLCRVPVNDAVWIKRVLDLGVAGVMAPAVDDAAAARELVASCRYPPGGRRGLAPTLVRAAGYGRDWRGYLERCEAELLIIAQVETRRAIEAVDEIVGVDGLDMLFIGPFDLSADLGHTGAPDHGEVRAAIERVERATKKAGLLLGGLPTPGRSAEELFAAGYHLVLGGSDVVLLRDAARADRERLVAAAGCAS